MCNLSYYLALANAAKTANKAKRYDSITEDIEYCNARK